MKFFCTALFALAVSAGATSYTTSFPATENPISQSGMWTNGGAVGLDWHDVRTTPGLAFGTEPGDVGDFDDAVANLAGTWGSNQTVTATVHVSADGATFEEVELLLRWSISAHNARGYECNYSVKTGGNAYCQIVRWNGSAGSFTQLTGDSTGVVNGDTIKATVVGNTISTYINNVLRASWTDNTWSNGTPGVGMYIHGGVVANNANFGLTTFTATDGTDTFPPSLAITSPANGANFSTSTASVTGTASDDVAVSSVTLTNTTTGNGFTVTGTTSWSATATLQSGSNVLQAVATDSSGNKSTNSITVSYTPSAPSTLLVSILRLVP